jgi:FkbM family methyltransferase
MNAGFRKNISALMVPIYCYLNRTLRYGNSSNRYLQFIVIRSRTYLKGCIRRNISTVNSLGVKKIYLAYAGSMELYTNDYIDRWLYTGADFEPHVVNLYLKILREGSNVLDVGANIGYFSIIASRLVGQSGKIYSFEPSPNTLIRLKRNISLNKFKNIIIYPKAVSEKVGFVVFKIPSDTVQNSGRSSFRDIEENSIEVEVPTINIDSLLQEIISISLVKMDIEGAEAMALIGMQKLIERDSPIFIMELSDAYLKQLGASAISVWDFFKCRDYKVFNAGNGLSALLESDLKLDMPFDILCIPQKKCEQYNLIVS